jgi:hypothetical protein
VKRVRLPSRRPPQLQVSALGGSENPRSFDLDLEEDESHVPDGEQDDADSDPPWDPEDLDEDDAEPEPEYGDFWLEPDDFED